MNTHTHPAGRWQRWPILLSLLGAVALGETRAEEWYLKIDGVPGELTQGPMAGWTPVQSVGALVARPVDSVDGTAGPPTFSCELRKGFDRTSPALLQLGAAGDPIRRVTLAHVQARPTAALHRITLDDARVISVSQEASGTAAGPVRAEKIEFTFTRMEMTRFELDALGGTAGGLTGLFDQRTGEGALKSRPPFRVEFARPQGEPGVAVTWPAESGHRYRILAGTALEKPWDTLAEVTTEADGPVTRVVPTSVPSLFMRVEEVD